MLAQRHLRTCRWGGEAAPRVAVERRSPFRWRVGREAPVRGDVGEYLLDQRENVRVLDGVDVVAAFLACTDQAGQTEFAQVLAHGGYPDAGAFRQGGDVVNVLGRKPQHV